MMRGFATVCFFSAASVAAGSGGVAEATWPWPWGTHTTTTSTTPTPLHSFEQGVAVALGLNDVTACAEDMGTAFAELKEGWADYKQGGVIKRAEAVAKFGEAIHEVVLGLEKCSDVGPHASRFLAFVKALRDPRFYTMHNALSLCLNLAEDRGQLSTFAKAWELRDFFLAGETLTNTIFDVVDEAGVSGSNGTAAVQIAAGLAEGFVSTFDIRCFQDVKVEVSSLVGGVLDVYSGAMLIPGLQSLANGLMGLVPAFKDCLAERPEIEALLEELADVRHPADLAKKWAHNIKDHGLDIGLEAASAILAYKGAEWHHFGKQVGEMLEKIAVAKPPATVVV